MVKKIVKYLSSLRFTILLIFLLGVVFAVGLWVPQKRLLKTIYLQWQHNSPALVSFLDTLGLTSIYTSPLTVTIWFLFFVNLSLVMWQRLPLIKKKITLSERSISDPVTTPGYPFKNAYPLPAGMSDDEVLGGLKKKGFTLLGDSTGFYGVRNRLAPIAFALFHLSFFLILLGGLISVYTEFIGYLDLAQGESFNGELSRFRDEPSPKMPLLGQPPNEGFTVKSITPHVTKNTATGIDVILVDQQGRSHDVDINVPWNVGATSFVFKHLGMAPLFVLKEQGSGKEIDGNYLKLDVLKGGRDRFALGGFEFVSFFYPDYAFEKGKHITKTQEFRNQMFRIAVKQNGKIIAEGNVSKDQPLLFSGYRLELQDLLFWVRFYVVKQHGLPILYLGFAIASFGVIWRLLFYRRELLGAIRPADGGRTLYVAARSEYYKSLAEDEFNKLFNSLTGKGRTDT
jgi:hypothetical protein